MSRLINELFDFQNSLKWVVQSGSRCDGTVGALVLLAVCSHVFGLWCLVLLVLHWSAGRGVDTELNGSWTI